MAEAFVVQGPSIRLVELAEATVHTGTPAPGIGTVNDVVMDEGRGLEKFQSAASRQDVRVSGGTARTPPAPVAHQRTKPFSACDEV